MLGFRELSKLLTAPSCPSMATPAGAEESGQGPPQCALACGRASARGKDPLEVYASGALGGPEGLAGRDAGSRDW